MSNTDKVLTLLEKVNQNADPTNELQSLIAPDVFFRKNSINLLIGKRGSGKTYNVFREMLKLNFIKEHAGYERFLYVTDKLSGDPTYERVKKYIKLETAIVPYADAVKHIEEIEKKAAREKSPKHSIVLLDDAQNVFHKRTVRNAALYAKLFTNRQARITYFLTLQDAIGISPDMKSNCDSIWIFGGFQKDKFDYMLRSIPHDTDNNEDLWRLYVNLARSQALVFKIGIDGTNLTIITK